MKDCKLFLEDHSCFTGFSFGSDSSVSGEVVFSTGMVGYPESLTDPSYKGQILCFTYPLIGNYGIPRPKKDKEVIENFESSKIQASGVIINDYSFDYSHWSAVKSLHKWLKDEGIPGIYGIDTRALTKRLREKGTMLGKIVNKKDIPLFDPNKINIVEEVSIKKPKVFGSGKKKVILIDCGAKNNIIRSLVSRKLKVVMVPWDYDFFKMKFDGIFVSNGPGDPKMCTSTIENLRTAMEKEIPTMGICLGNQLLALAAGGDTYKLKYGHRSQNQPCIEVGTKKCYITTQNHGFAVDAKKLPKGWKLWFKNANDGTVEGIRHESKPFKSVQFHPEACPGPVDTGFLFDQFVEML